MNAKNNDIKSLTQHIGMNKLNGNDPLRTVLCLCGRLSNWPLEVDPKAQLNSG